MIFETFEEFAAALPPMRPLLGLDLGEKTIGVAASEGCGVLSVLGSTGRTGQISACAKAPSWAMKASKTLGRWRRWIRPTFTPSCMAKGTRWKAEPSPPTTVRAAM